MRRTHLEELRRGDEERRDGERVREGHKSTKCEKLRPKCYKNGRDRANVRERTSYVLKREEKTQRERRMRKEDVALKKQEDG